jgi:hypothetical protein
MANILPSTFNLRYSCTIYFNLGDYDAFIARADSTGKIKWVHKIKSQTSRNYDIKLVSNKDNILSLLNHEEFIKFLGNPLTASGYDILLSTLDENGILKWVKKFNINSSNLSAGLGLK